MAIQILDIAKIAFSLGVFLFLFKIGKSKKDAAKLKEWEILSFTLLLVSVLFVENVTWSYYTSFLILSFVLMVFVLPLSFVEKIVFITILGLFLARVEIAYLCWLIGGTVKTIAFIIQPETVAYILLLTLVIYIIRERTKSQYWTRLHRP